MSNTPETVVEFELPAGLGERTPLGAPCRYCGSADTWVELRLVPKPVGSYSISGAQDKVVASEWPHAVCGGCGHVSVGKPA